ncbi:MAG TPA: molybdopterin-dependent oxidoreductase [Acidobacteriaceae bacterium]
MSEIEDERERVIVRGDAAAVKAESARRTRRSFLVGGVAAAAGYGVLHWVNNSRPVGRLQGVLRKSLNVDAAINRAVWDERGLAPEYPVSEAKELRLNGVVGLDETLKPESWRLQLVGVAGAASLPLYAKDVTAWEYEYAGAMGMDQQMLDVKDAPRSTAKASALNPDGAVDSTAGAALAARIEAMTRGVQTKRRVGNAEAGASYSGLDIGTPGLLLAMGDLMKLPKVTFCTQFKCIEGWSVITQWGGYRLRDLMEMYPPEKVGGREPRYVYMETPDGNYYCGFDMKAARHPQSLLVTEMSGQPLTQVHGAPLRLHMPIKYGYKQIKRIGLIAYTDRKPDDFWRKLGYDWYAGI